MTAEAHGTAAFSFARWDSIDKQYDFMGSTSIDFVEPLEIEAVITFTHISKDELVIESVEVQSHGATLHYDDLEPDWMSEPENFYPN